MSSPAVDDSVLVAAPTAAVAPAAVDRVLATQRVPESNATAPTVVGQGFQGDSPIFVRPFGCPKLGQSPSSFALLPASPVPVGDAMARVAALRTAASNEASDEVLLGFVEARAGNAERGPAISIPRRGSSASTFQRWTFWPGLPRSPSDAGWTVRSSQNRANPCDKETVPCCGATG